LKAIKIFLWITGVLVFLGVGAVLVVTNLVDPNDYKPKIEQIVKAQTGRNLSLVGDLALTFYPWIGINTGLVELSNREGFGEEPMLSIEQADIRIKLLPLLRKEIEIGNIVLNRPRILLVTLSNGHTNWDDLMTIVESKTQNTGGGEVAVVAGLAIQGVSLVGGEVIWNDQNANQQLKISKLDLATGQIQPGVPLEIDLAMDVSGNSLPDTVSIQLSTTTKINDELNVASLDNTEFSVKTGEKTYELVVPSMVLELEKQSLSIPEYVFSHGELNLDGELNMSNLLASPTASGQLNLVAPDIDRILSDAEITLDAGKNKFGKLGLESRFSYLNNIVEINTLTADVVINGQDTSVDLPFASVELLNEVFSLQGLAVRQGDMELRGSLAGVGSFSDPGIQNVDGSLTVKLNPVAVLEQNNIEINLAGFEIGETTLETKFSYTQEKIEVSDLVADALVNGQKTSIDLPLAAFNFSGQGFSLQTMNIQQNDLKINGSIRGSGIYDPERLNLDGSLKLSINPGAVFEQNGMEVDLGGYKIGETELDTRFTYSQDKVEVRNLIADTLINDQSTHIGIPVASLQFVPQRLTLPNVSIQQSGVDIKGNVTGEGLFSDPGEIGLEGVLDLDISDLSKFLESIQLEEVLPPGLITGISSNLDIQIEDGSLWLSSMKTSADEMQLAGDIAVVNLLSDSEMDIRIIQDIANIDIGKTLSALAVTEDLEGTGFVHLNLTGINPDAAQPLSNMGGQIDFNMKNGAVKGFDLQAALIQVSNAVNVAQGKQETRYKPDVQTKFSELSGKFDGENGRFKTDSLAMMAPGLRVNGNGAIDLPGETIDLKFDVSIVKTVEGQGGAALADLEGVSIPLTVSGNLAAPDYGLDFGGLLKREIKKEVKKEVEKEISKQLLKLLGD
jgi:uncharacterized protein involved in outer membrane biogenesis